MGRSEVVDKFNYLELTLESTRALNKQETSIKMKGYKVFLLHRQICIRNPHYKYTYVGEYI
jgi:hypothetical protein